MNRLSHETSLYLLQHANNPVNWFPWGDEAFEAARKHNKLMLISIGYSSCHWCHVMEREAFSNNEVADFLNQNFICVKVDREERPDVDKIYMNAVQIITRSGGWPLNCFATPDGRPVYGGTYFRTEAWLDIIQSLHQTWVNDSKRVIEVAEELHWGIAKTEIITNKEPLNELSISTIKSFTNNWSKFFDLRYGGQKGAPKFILPGSIHYLLDYSWVFKDDNVKKHVFNTLELIRLGGIYDHLGGGFFRYSVDERWEVPHFEKMLYDNTQLINLYSHAFKHSDNENYKTIAYQTIDFITNELGSHEGGFYSAIDADSEGEEGKYYTFTKDEIEKQLGVDSEIFMIYYGVSAVGNFHCKNVLREAATIREVASLLGVDIQGVEIKIKQSKDKLLSYRLKRKRPLTDDKQILSWNALAVSSLANASVIFEERRFLNQAIKSIEFIEAYLITNDDVIKRIYCKGKASIPALFDDLAFLIQSYISLYKATLETKWLEKAKRITSIAINQFFDKDSGMFFFTSKEHDNLIVRKMELTDGVIPSSAGVMAENLMFLGCFFRSNEFRDTALQMVCNISNQLDRGGPFMYQWAHLYLKMLIGSTEITSTQNEGKTLISFQKQTLNPFIILKNNHSIAEPISENKHVFQVCRNNHCNNILFSDNEVLDVIDRITL